MRCVLQAFKTGDVNMAEETAQASGTALNMNGFGELDEDPMMLSDFEDEDGYVHTAHRPCPRFRSSRSVWPSAGSLAMPLAAADNLWVKMTSQAPSVSVNDLDDDEFGAWASLRWSVGVHALPVTLTSRAARCIRR